MSRWADEKNKELEKINDSKISSIKIEDEGMDRFIIVNLIDGRSVVIQYDYIYGIDLRGDGLI